MNIKKAKQEIKFAIAAYLLKNDHGEYEIPPMRQRPILLMGPPGIGKTQIMEQIAREEGIGLVCYTITHHTRQSAIGLPFISQKEYDGEACQVTGYTMSEIVASVYDKIEQSDLREGILFIDEINCVSETLAPTMLQFLQYKTFGNHKIPEGWIIVSAGNPPEYNKSVREFDMATLDRVKKIPVEANFEVWKEYAYQAGIHPAVIAYLNAKTKHFYKVEMTVEGKAFATPRGWEDLSKLIQVYESLKQTVDRDLVLQYIQHDKIARDFAAYLELYYKYQSDYQIDSILENGHGEAVVRLASQGTFDEKLSIVGILLAKLVGKFKEVGKNGSYLTELLEILSQLKTKEGDMIAALENMIEDYSRSIEKKKDAGLLGREEQYRMTDVSNRLKEYLQDVKMEHVEASGIWDYIKACFNREGDFYDNLVERTGKMLERGFDFMEAAFGDSQEMVIFVTELNTNQYSVSFLKEYECERYFYYNKRLLFEDREDEIKQSLREEGL